MKKLIIGGLIIVVGICIGSFKVATNMINSNSAKNNQTTVNVDKAKIVKAKTNSVLAEPGSGKIIGKKITTRIEIVTRIHEMSNTLILAEDNKIWGKVEVNKETVSELLNMLNNSKAFEERDTFITMSRKWQNSDFTNIVDDHNMVWKILEGTIGRAHEPNIPAVDEAKKSLK